MLATTYPLLDAFWTMLWFFAFILWIWIVIMIVVDIFRSSDIGGVAKAAWLLFVVLVPLLGVVVYVAARGRGMHERHSGFGPYAAAYAQQTGPATRPAEDGQE
jgi:predicted membrane channel-forming protein YqfA (hemolysin III family)